MMRNLTRFIVATLIAASVFTFSSCGSSNSSSNRRNEVSRPVVYKPLVTIRNNSSKSILLGLKGPETRFVSIPARSSRQVNLLSGSYKYAATAKNTKTISGYKYFGTNNRYTWNFNIN